MNFEVGFICVTRRMEETIRDKRTIYNQALFSRIHNQKLWQTGDSVSGPGSELDATHNVRNLIAKLISQRSISTIVDAACGDVNWQHHIINPPVKYIGIDIVAELIHKLTKTKTTGFREFRVADIVRDTLPAADLIICRDVLQHMEIDDAEQFVKNTWRSKNYSWIVASTNSRCLSNTDITPGFWRPLNLLLSPFNLPEPNILIDDDSPMKQLGVWKIFDD